MLYIDLLFTDRHLLFSENLRFHVLFTPYLFYDLRLFRDYASSLRHLLISGIRVAYRNRSPKLHESILFTNLQCN